MISKNNENVQKLAAAIVAGMDYDNLVESALIGNIQYLSSLEDEDFVSEWKSVFGKDAP